MISTVNIGAGGTDGNSALGGAGGGAVVLTVTGTVTLNGSIAASGLVGLDTFNGSGGGAGGSVNLTCSALSGSGSITANGGDAGSGNGGGGGGGRIAITGTNSVATITAYGGSGKQYGGAGTVVVNGALTVDNNSHASTAVTAITSSVTNASVSSVTISNTGRLTVNASQSLTASGTLAIGAGTTLVNLGTINVAGNWSKTGTFTDTSGTVNLTGGGGSVQTLSNSSSFFNLSATCAATRTIRFAAGSTQVVSGTLTLQGGSGQLVLRSDADGSSWNINPQGSWTVDHVDVRDAVNLAAAPINPASSADVGAGGNSTVNWFAPLAATLLSPVHNPDGTATYGHTLNVRPALIGQLGTYCLGGKLHVRVLLDGATGTTLLANSATSQAGFEYFSGSWQAFPAGGVDPGTRVRWTPQADQPTGYRFWNLLAADPVGRVGAAATVRRFRIDTAPWSSDTTLAVGLPVRVIHLSQLRDEANAARAFRNDGILATLPAITWSDDPLVARLTPIRKAHLDELRAALTAAAAVSGSGVTIGAASLTAGQTQIRAAHFLELRTALGGL